MDKHFLFKEHRLLLRLKKTHLISKNELDKRHEHNNKPNIICDYLSKSSHFSASPLG